MASIAIHGNVGKVQLLESIFNAFKVGRLRTCALGHVRVGHQVGKLK